MSTPDSLVDEEALATWLDDQGLEQGGDLALEKIKGGTSNEMFRVRRGEAEWVLRRPSGVTHARAQEGLKREFRILTALDGTAVPAPAPVALCEEQNVLGCTFYLMESVRGFVPIDPLPDPFAEDEGARSELAYALVRSLAELHRLDWRAKGLADFGRIEGWHERQVSRWTSQWESDGGREVDGMEEVGAWLEANIPYEWAPTIMHGDYHMLNVMIAPELPARVAAIVDWETSTIGDPMLDLAGFLRIWCPFHPSPWPSWDDLVVCYEEAAGVKVPDLQYYSALYHFKLFVLLEGIYQRSLRDPSRPDAEQAGAVAMMNAQHAVSAVRGEFLP